MPDDKDKLPDIVSLTSLKGGVAVELFDYELHRVLENIADDNTEPDEVREITLKVAFKPDEDRQAVAMQIKCKANKLAGPKQQGSVAYVGRRHGAVVAVEYDPRQVDIFDPDAGADITPITRKGKETG